MPPKISYVIISPARDEGKHIQLTIRSIVDQTIPPSRWIIVNDGSTDNTGPIAEEAARLHPWIHVIHRGNRGFRQAGGGVVDAFYEGYRRLEDDSWDYIVKLDADLSFAPNYFENCFSEFARNARLGIAGGTICAKVNGGLTPEAKDDPKFHVRGATKIYRSSCWRDIGGLLPAPGWDTLDEVKANMLGWTTHTLSGINALHHRPTGAAYGTWNDRVKAGLANYISGYHPLFMVLKCVKRMGETPYIAGGLALLFGFAKGYLTRVPQVDDKRLIEYFRRQQLNRLLGKKSLWD